MLPGVTSELQRTGLTWAVFKSPASTLELKGEGTSTPQNPPPLIISLSTTHGTNT